MHFTTDYIKQSIPSNYNYGNAIFSRNAVEIISQNSDKVVVWVGGLTGKIIEGGGFRRKVTCDYTGEYLVWKCTGNPKNHQIFCKHCVALALKLCDE